MNTKKTGPDEADSQPDGSAQVLRERAEENIRARKPHYAESWLPSVARELLHDLRVHQVELEMQNEELRHKQEELENAQAKYFSLYNLAPVGYFTVSETGVALEANLMAANLFGTEKGLLVNQKFTRFIIAEDQDIYYLFRKRLFETGLPQTREIRMERADGGQFFARIDATVAINAQSGEPGLNIAVSDITERKQAETEAISVKTQLQATLDAIPDPLFEMGLDGRYYNYHSHQSDLQAAPSGVFLGKTVSEVFAPPAANVVMSALREAYENGYSYGRQFELQLAKGKLYFELSVARKSTAGGQEPRFIVLSRDITGRKEAEIERAKLATAVMRAADAVVITDPEGRIEYVNPAFEEITGYRMGEVRGKNPRVIKSGQHEQAFYEELWRTIKSGQVWRGHIVNRKKDGSLYDEEMTISPITDASGAIAQFVAVKRDVTQEALLEKSRDYFTAITSHELRTPMLKVHLAENILRQAETAGLAGGHMEKAHSALLDAMASFDRIVNASTLISEMTRTGAERKFASESIYLNATEALESAQANIGKALRDIRIETDMAGLPHNAAAMGNHRMIQQALDEALSNAIKYTPDGRAIRVRAYAAGGSVHVEVADEGEGIPEENLGDVFIPYYSLENPLNHSTGRYKFRGGGMGLGLTLARLIMEYHNGSLTIGKRAEGTGTLVALIFPLANEGAPVAEG